MSAPLRVLVTNDDGIDSEGLRQLALAARAEGHEVVIAAPMEEASGSSSALNAVEDHGRIVVERRRLTGLEEVPAHSVDGLPGFIALIAMQGAFGTPPDLVLSGINRGANTGYAIIHSGTVGAAFTAVVNGCRAMAVSLDAGHPMRWASAAHVARSMLPLLAATDPGAVLNLNVPNLSIDAIKGLRRAELAPFGAVQTKITERGAGFVRLTVAETDPDPDLRTDAGLLAEGYATLSLLQPPRESAATPLAPLPDVSVPHSR
ncbi:5'/3'-nucleotidase SurE [Peterkaempfera bronchialis]|uniref:5'/3'-nucleotidase SurE n=1 Tax=Peterkaempfera bronchialis TaxID=2126346 RepID=UPI003C2FE297